MTVTSPDEAVQAAAAGADALVVQGIEAGGHRGSFRDDPADDQSGGFALLALLQLVRERTSLPLVAAGGIGTGAAIAAVLAAGATAAQLGTAFLRCPEAGTLGRAARGHRRGDAHRDDACLHRTAGARHPQPVHRRPQPRRRPPPIPRSTYLTAPLRAAGRSAGNPDLVNLWAGQAHELSRELPAGQLVAALAGEAREALGCGGPPALARIARAAPVGYRSGWRSRRACWHDAVQQKHS